MALGNAFVGDQQQDARNPNKATDNTHSFMVHFAGEVAPAFKIEGAVLLIYCAGNPLIKQGKGTLDRRNVDRQVRSVQNQYFAVQHYPACGINRKYVRSCRHDKQLAAQIRPSQASGLLLRLTCTTLPKTGLGVEHDENTLT